MLDITRGLGAPQVRDLPRDAEIAVSCTCCGKRWGESVRDMVEARRLGARFMDLLEWETRCADDDCGGRVEFAYAGKPVAARPVVVTAVRARPSIASYPVKAVVKRRHATPQYSLPMALPAMSSRRVAGRMPQF